MALDIVLFPYCDLHVALNVTTPLQRRVSSKDLVPGNMSYILTYVTSAFSFDFFAAYNPVISRLPGGATPAQFVNINRATSIVTPTAVETNLVQIRFGNHYIIARTQVHDIIQG